MTAQRGDIRLAGDIGGTKTLLAAVEEDAGRIFFSCLKEYSSRDYPDFESLLTRFLNEVPCRPSSNGVMALGVAGPVIGRRCKTSNLPWLIDADRLQKQFRLTRVELVNDFEAIVHGIFRLETRDLAMLHQGIRAEGPHTLVVLGAGTGLGEAGAVFNAAVGRYQVIPTEGGHSDFAPQSDQEIQLLKYLQQKYDHVSYERLLSGSGLATLYSFLSEQSRSRPAPGIEEEMAREDPAAVVTRYALERNDPLCLEALNLFVSIYGAEAGNIALKFLARGGVYLAGGIAPKILSKLQDGTFMKSFIRKGRYEGLMKTFPVYVILNPQAGLLGAADLSLSYI
jgi:glucokinase